MLYKITMKSQALAQFDYIGVCLLTCTLFLI